MNARRTVAVVLLAGCGTAWADGVHFPSEKAWRESREKSLVSEPTQKAVLMLDRGVETLIVSPGFAGDAADFAWVIPVPKRPKVEIVKGALFHEMARLVEP